MDNSNPNNPPMITPHLYSEEEMQRMLMQAREEGRKEGSLETLVQSLQLSITEVNKNLGEIRGTLVLMMPAAEIKSGYVTKDAFNFLRNAYFIGLTAMVGAFVGLFNKGN